MHEEIIQKFKAKFKEGGQDECWIWFGAKSGKYKYGHMAIKGRHHKAHRLAWEIANNELIPENLVARHTCDNTLCVNPAHIIPGTTLQNVQDKMEKGRHRYGILIGEENSRSKITSEQVRLVVRLAACGFPQPEIATKTGVSKTNVGAIIQGRTWRHITGFKSPS